MPTIHFNGKTYNDLAEMPASERQMYEQLMSLLVVGILAVVAIFLAGIAVFVILREGL